jgi:hypothetical protein
MRIAIRPVRAQFCSFQKPLARDRKIADRIIPVTSDKILLSGRGMMEK